MIGQYFRKLWEWLEVVADIIDMILSSILRIQNGMSFDQMTNGMFYSLDPKTPGPQTPGPQTPDPKTPDPKTPEVNVNNFHHATFYIKVLEDG